MKINAPWNSGVSFSGGSFSGSAPNVIATLTTSQRDQDNAFNFKGRLQDYSSFLVTYDVLCTGPQSSYGNGIYFYFGGTSPPDDEGNCGNCVGGQSNAIIISNDVYAGGIFLYYGPGEIEYSAMFNSYTNTWITMSVQYFQYSKSTVTIIVSANSEVIINQTITGMQSWFSSISGSDWGFAARCGDAVGTFSFSQLQANAVQTGAYALVSFHLKYNREYCFFVCLVI